MKSDSAMTWGIAISLLSLFCETSSVSSQDTGDKLECPEPRDERLIGTWKCYNAGGVNTLGDTSNNKTIKFTDSLYFIRSTYYRPRRKKFKVARRRWYEEGTWCTCEDNKVGLFGIRWGNELVIVAETGERIVLGPENRDSASSLIDSLRDLGRDTVGYGVFLAICELEVGEHLRLSSIAAQPTKRYSMSPSEDTLWIFDPEDLAEGLPRKQVWTRQNE